MTLRIRKAIKNKSFYFPAVKFIMPIRNKTWYGFHKKFKKIILKKTLSWNRNPLNAGGESSNLSSENKLAGILLTSCGGTSKDTVLRSTHLKWSIQGITKNIPGPWKAKSKYLSSISKLFDYYYLQQSAPLPLLASGGPVGISQPVHILGQPSTVRYLILSKWI